MHSFLLLSQTETVYFEDWTNSDGSQLTQVQNEFLEQVVSIDDPVGGGIYVASSTFNDVTQVHDLLLGKYTDAGTTVWTTQFNISGGGDVLVGGLALDGSGNVLFTGAVLNGSNSYDALTVKFSSAGVVQWNQTHNGSASGYDGGTAVATDASGNVYVKGVATESSTSMDYLVLAYTSSGTLLWSQLFDASGRLVLEKNAALAADLSVSVDLSKFSAGVYFAQLIDNENIYPAKIILH